MHGRDKFLLAITIINVMLLIITSVRPLFAQL